MRQEATQLDSPNKVGLDLTKSQKKRLRRKEKKAEKRRGSRKRTRRVEMHPTDLTNKTTPILTGTQQMGSKQKQKKKKQSSDGI